MGHQLPGQTLQSGILPGMIQSDLRGWKGPPDLGLSQVDLVCGTRKDHCLIMKERFFVVFENQVSERTLW